MENQFISERPRVSPEDAFEKRWADAARTSPAPLARGICGGRQDRGRSAEEILGGRIGLYAELSAQLGSSEGAARVTCIAPSIAIVNSCGRSCHTVADPKDVDDELRHLIAVISG